MDLARVRLAAREYATALRDMPQDPRVDYAADFCDRLIAMIDREPERREKIMRWYGWIQGALWALGVYTVDELKAHSRPDMEPGFERPS